jgi:hypothetical protein
MKLPLIILLLLCFSQVQAALQAGDVELIITTDGKMLEVRMEAAAKNILGFEHQPQTNDQKQKWSQFENLWQNNINQIISLKANCNIQERTLELEALDEEVKRAAIQGVVVYQCSDLAKFNELIFKLKKLYTQVKQVKTTVIPDRGSPYKKISLEREVKIQL